MRSLEQLKLELEQESERVVDAEADCDRADERLARHIRAVDAIERTIRNKGD